MLETKQKGRLVKWLIAGLEEGRKGAHTCIDIDMYRLCAVYKERLVKWLITGLEEARKGAHTPI